MTSPFVQLLDSGLPINATVKHYAAHDSRDVINKSRCTLNNDGIIRAHPAKQEVSFVPRKAFRDGSICSSSTLMEDFNLLIRL